MAKPKHVKFNVYFQPSQHPIDRKITSFLQIASDQKNASTLLKQAMIFYYLQVVEPWLEAGGDISLGLPPFPQDKNTVSNDGGPMAEIDLDVIKALLREELVTHLGDVRVMLDVALQNVSGGTGDVSVEDEEDELFPIFPPETF